MNNDYAIKIDHISKVYKIFNKPTDRVKEALNPFRKRYSKDFYALDEVSFAVKKGETVGIIGKNGAGKSTLLKIITGVLTPSSGSIEVQGRIASLLELGAGFNPEMSGIENIYLNGTIMGYSKEDMDEKLQDIVDFADIGDFIHQPVKMYSSGMFARLAFAVNVNVTPDILIVDEALSVGDVFFQNKCFKKMGELRDSGISILFVSHDMGSIRQLCDSCLWLEGGTVRQYGDVETVAAAYINEELTQYNDLYKDSSDLSKNITSIPVDRRESILRLPLLSCKQGLKNDEVIIKSFSFFEHEKMVATLENGHTYKTKFAVEFKKAYKNLIFGFILENNRGIPVLCTNSWMVSEGEVVNVSEPGTVVVSFEFELPKILTGDYTVSPAVAQGSQKENIQLTYLENAMSVNVKSNGYNFSIIEIDADVTLERYQDGCVEYYEG